MAHAPARYVMDDTEIANIKAKLSGMTAVGHDSPDNTAEEADSTTTEKAGSEEGVESAEGAEKGSCAEKVNAEKNAPAEKVSVSNPAPAETPAPAENPTPAEKGSCTENVSVSNPDGSVNLQQFKDTKAADVVPEIGKRRVRFTNVMELGAPLNASQVDRFFGDSRPAAGWLVAVLATRDMFNEDSPQYRMDLQYLDVLFQANSLLEARHKLEKMVVNKRRLRGVDFVAIPIGQALAVPFQPYSGVDLSEFTEFTWLFEGTDPDTTNSSNNEDANNNDDDDISRMEADAEARIKAVDNSVPKNTLVWLSRAGRNTMSQRSWANIVRQLVGDKTAQRFFSTLNFVDIYDITEREFLLGREFCEKVVAMCEHHKFLLKLVRFSGLHARLPDDSLSAANMLAEFNTHISAIELETDQFSRWPFHSSDIKDVRYVSDTHKQMMSSLVQRSKVDQLTKVGDRTIHVDVFGFPWSVYLDTDKDNMLQRIPTRPKQDHFEEYLRDEEAAAKNYRIGFEHCLERLHRELKRIAEFPTFEEYSNSIKNLFQTDPAKVANPDI